MTDALGNQQEKVLWEWRHPARLTHLSQGNSPLAAWEQLLLFGANPGCRNRLQMLWSELPPPLERQRGKGMLPGERHGHPPGLSGACPVSSAALGLDCSISFESLPPTFWQGFNSAANKPYSAHRPGPAPASSGCPVGLLWCHLRWGGRGRGRPRAGMRGAAGQSGVVGPGLQLGGKGKEKAEASDLHYFIIFFIILK